MPTTTTAQLTGGKKAIPKYATAKTQAGRRRQVKQGRALMTGPGGLRAKDIKAVKGKGGTTSYVSKVKSDAMKKKRSNFVSLAASARKGRKSTLKYKGTSYFASQKGGKGLIMYVKSQRTAKANPVKKWN